MIRYGEGVDDSFEGLNERGIWESVPDAMILVDPSGTIRLANLEANRMFGYAEGMTGLSVDSLLPEGMGTAHASLRKGFHVAPRRRAMGAGLRLEARRGDGSVFPVQISLSPLGSDLVIAAVRDITDLRGCRGAPDRFGPTPHPGRRP